MKFNFLYTLFSIALCAFVFLGNSGGRADTQNWGNTGAPGDETLANGNPRTCQSCHNNSATTQVTLSIDVVDAEGNNINDIGYVAGVTYDVTVTVNVASGSPELYGFQMVCLNAEEGVDGNEVPSWSDLGANVKSAIASNTNRTYVEQNGPSTTNTFTMKWTGPPTGWGTVTFYSCGNAVNNNGMTSGDAAACTTLTLEETIGVSTNNLAQHVNLSIAPNPVAETMNLRIESQTQEDISLRIFDNAACLVLAKAMTLEIGENNAAIDLSFLATGHYTVHVQNEEGNISKQMIKL